MNNPGKWAVKDHARERSLFNRRLAVAVGIGLVMLATLIGQLLNLQVSQFEYFSSRADENRLHSQFVPPPRGLIYDRSGLLLAANRPIHNLTVVREHVPDLADSLAMLGTLIDISANDIEQFHDRSRRERVPYASVPFKFVLTEEEKSRIAVNSHRLPGFAIGVQFVRSYPFEALTAHAVGYVGEINREELAGMNDAEREGYGGTNHIGKTGAEKTYEGLLHGTVGYETVEKNSMGVVMRQLNRMDPVPGRDLTLHLEMRLQMAANAALGDFRGAVVAIEPATGGILAMLSKPGFDPNLFVTGIGHADYRRLVEDDINTPLFDRSTSPFPPGSTIKPFLGLAGLELGTVTPDFTIEDPGYFDLAGVEHRWHDWTYRTDLGGGHGTTDLRKAIFQSCDTYFYELGNRLGIDNMHRYLARFGFGANLSLDLGYARTGLLPSAEWKMRIRGEAWYPGDTVNAAIGQGHMWMTPLQLATAAAVLANKGELVPPRLLRKVGNEDYYPLSNTVPSSIMKDASHWELVEGAMIDVVHRGQENGFRDYGTAYPYTAALASERPYRVAGKTGTSQVVGIGQDIENSDDIEVADHHKDHALFIAYAPAGDPRIEPQIALAVVVENGESGSSVAAPIAMEIIDAYLLDILQIDFESSEEGDGRLLSQL